MRRCSAGGELGEGPNGAEQRDDGDTERRRSIERLAWCSSGVSMRG
jgi:hypothetical protein